MQCNTHYSQENDEVNFEGSYCNLWKQRLFVTKLTHRKYYESITLFHVWQLLQQKRSKLHFVWRHGLLLSLHEQAEMLLATFRVWWWRVMSPVGKKTKTIQKVKYIICFYYYVCHHHHHHLYNMIFLKHCLEQALLFR